MAENKRHIVISVDDTDASTRAVQWAVQQFSKPGDELHLTHVVLRLSKYDYPDANMIIEKGHNPYALLEECKEREDILAYMRRRFLPILEGGGVPYHLDVIRNVLLQEGVAATLVRAARHWNTPVIIVGKHHKGFDKILHGSVSSQIVSNAPMPVVLVK